MPSLLKPKAKPDGKQTRTSGVWHIRYFCRFRRRSKVISTCCKSRKNAERRLREFCDLLECGEVGRENPFLARLRKEAEDPPADRRAIGDCLAAFEIDLRAGRLRKRGRREAVGDKHADTTLARVRRILDGCGVESAERLTV